MEQAETLICRGSPRGQAVESPVPAITIPFHSIPLPSALAALLGRPSFSPAEEPVPADAISHSCGWQRNGGNGIGPGIARVRISDLVLAAPVWDFRLCLLWQAGCGSVFLSANLLASAVWALVRHGRPIPLPFHCQGFFGGLWLLRPEALSSCNTVSLQLGKNCVTFAGRLLDRTDPCRPGAPIPNTF
jgi:hypothetical protein